MTAAARVLIVGAGIAGLTAAVALRRRGAEVDIVERAPAFAANGAGITIQPNASAILAALDVHLPDDDVSSIGHVMMVDARGRPFVEVNADIVETAHRSLNIRRPDLHRALLTACGEPGVRLGRALTSLERLQGGVRATFSDGDAGVWDLVIGADGVRSTVRAATHPAAACAPRYSGQTCWRFVADAPGGAPETTVERWSPGRRVGIVPLSRGGVYVYMVDSSPPGTPGPGSASVAALRERFGAFDERLDPVLEQLAREPNPRVHHGDLVDLPVLSYGEGRVLLLGDAAHAMTPNMGQGGGTAIEDACALALLWGRVPLDRLADEMTRLRLARVREVHKKSWRIGQVAHLRGPVRRWLRDLLMRSVPASALVRGMRETWAPGIELAQRLRALEGR